MADEEQRVPLGNLDLLRHQACAGGLRETSGDRGEQQIADETVQSSTSDSSGWGSTDARAALPGATSRKPTVFSGC
jgi:hypothetical protein